MWILEPVWKQDYDRGEKEGGQQQGWILPGCYIEYCKYLIVCLFMIHFPPGFFLTFFKIISCVCCSYSVGQEGWNEK